MAYFIQLKRIQEIDTTPEAAIASFGSFVKYAEGLRSRVAKSKRKGWSNERISYHTCLNAIPSFHAAIRVKFGLEVMYEAINSHPFK